MRVSKNGIARNGKRGGNIARLNTVSQAYASAVASSSKQYDGHNGKTASVRFARLCSEGPLLREDSLNSAIVRELGTELPAFDKDDTK